MADKTYLKGKNILFYTSIPRCFRSTLVGYFYELCQTCNVFLLSKKLDTETEILLSDKKLFPNLKEIISVDPPDNLLLQNKYFYKLAKNIVKSYNLDAIILPSDIYPIFELYLMRLAKRKKILKIAVQPSYIAESKKALRWVDLTNAYARFPSFLPLFFRMFLVKLRKYFGHIVYYLVFPLFVGEPPFWGMASFILRRGISGMRDSDYQTVFSSREYKIHLEEGVPGGKLYILQHPLSREKTRAFFEEAYPDEFKRNGKDGRNITMMLPEQVGFRIKDETPITAEERNESWVEIVRLTSQVFLGWKIYIKPHPDTKNISEIRKILESVSENVKIVDLLESADKYIGLAEIIIGLPLSASTTLFTAFLQYPEKPILSLDFEHEIYGDLYKNFKGIEYVNSKDKFIEILKLIEQGKYKKPKIESEKGNFKDMAELLEYLLRKRETSLRYAK